MVDDIKEKWAVWDYNEYDALYELLINDIKILKNNIRKKNDQTYRRTLARAVFAMIEGTIYSLKLSILSYGYPGLLGDDEVQFLKEEKEIEKNKKKTVVKYYLPTHKNIFKTINFYAEFNDSEYRINSKNIGWNLLKNALEIRNRVTHPRRSQELFISEEELTLIDSTYIWFVNTIIELHKSCYESLSKTARKMKDLIDKI